jgi:DNA-binding transcriptional regulator YiaG
MIESGNAPELRTSHGLSLGVAAHAIGVSPTTLLRWERGERNPQGRNLVAYHKFLMSLAARGTRTATS